MVPRCVLVERATEYQELLARHGTFEQARFFLAGRGKRIEELAERHEQHRLNHKQVLAAVPPQWRRASVQREDLDRFLFADDDVIVVLGQDGLVANVAKYLGGQPVIGLNPDPGVHPGVLVPHPPEAAGELMRDLGRGQVRTQKRTMVAATLDDGQSLTALNEIFVGHVSHQSARYTITVAGATERQSSSGVLVATGTGATGWAASIHLERHSSVQLPAPEDPQLAFFVREAWPSPATGTTITEGRLDRADTLTITSELGEGAILFGDGIESDRIHVDWGQTITIQTAAQALHLVK
jgi:NAD kinase